MRPSLIRRDARRRAIKALAGAATRPYAVDSTEIVGRKACENPSQAGLKRVTVGVKGWDDMYPVETPLGKELGQVVGCRYIRLSGTKASWRHVPSMGRYTPTANEKRKRETARATLGL